MYQLMNNSNNAFYLIEVEDGKIVGFVSGVISIRGFYKEFFKKNFIKGTVYLLPKLLKPVTMRKTLETLFYPAKKENDLPDAELLSIVVEENYQGKGVARKLFIKLVDEFKTRGVFRFKVVVGSNLIAACRFYEKNGWSL
ncbi:GNAT family N-acetyltransferase [Candidatus Kuenenia sp.]|uniref:GNAT family N-acetyltransferase n=1 Tax=Candidatus Kuenenia sp. TaxID=2499824 RepID=UPI0030B92859